MCIILTLINEIFKVIFFENRLFYPYWEVDEMYDTEKNQDVYQIMEECRYDTALFNIWDNDKFYNDTSLIKTDLSRFKFKMLEYHKGYRSDWFK